MMRHSVGVAVTQFVCIILGSLAVSYEFGFTVGMASLFFGYALLPPVK